MQMAPILNDQNGETWGLNRRPLESLPNYIRRVYSSNILSESACFGLDEMLPCKFAEYNSYLKTFKSTYYFAHATGSRKRIREKARDIFSEPKKLTRNAIGFDVAVSQSLKYRSSTKRLSRRDTNE